MNRWISSCAAIGLILLSVPEINAQVPPIPGPLTLRVHDIRDLLPCFSNHAMKPFNSGDTPENQDTRIFARKKSARECFLAELQAYLGSKNIPDTTYHIDPRPVSSHKGGGWNEGALIVNATDAAHREIKVFLDRQRLLARELILIEARIFQIKDISQDLPAGLTKEPLGKEDTIFYLNQKQASALFSELKKVASKKNSNVQSVTTPRITSHNNQRAHMTLGERIAYIAGYNLIKVLGQVTEVTDPVIKTLQLGVGLELKVNLKPEDLSQAQVELFYQHARMEKPIQSKKTRHGRIQLPRVQTSSLKFKVRIALPGHVLLASKEQEGYGVDLILVSISRADLDTLTLKKRASVKAASAEKNPASNKVTLFIKAGHDAHLEKGETVRFFRIGESGRPEILFKGTIRKVYADLSEVEAILPDSNPRPDCAEATTWWCQWNPRSSRKKI